ncbi:DUF1642 domain-containing protein [Streptococcus suis]|uniref:DUF1642 domain-containing protein n=1 Tax=Streptococcus suis TaxID=1307 RepID=UPI000F63D8E0|nr:DUF1642 domain-containing protein [Streptococcus suis]RRR48838.1 DUF1642 domain-containing protein [Streptococcus suis]HEL1658505.1 DUF1642 domain-containing protein [Streptococcus suis]
MNKQEAIEIIEQSKIKIANRGRVIFNAGEIIVENVQVDYVPLEVVVNTIDQIHEPQKVVVPKFVAEWIEGCKHSGWHLQKVLSNLDDDEKVGDWAYDKNDDLILEKVDMIARAWLDGYEIEQEQLYTVEIPNNGGFIVLAYINHAMKLVDGNKHLPGKFTKESIEFAGFGWVFDCSGVKVVEVE